MISSRFLLVERKPRKLCRKLLICCVGFSTTVKFLLYLTQLTMKKNCRIVLKYEKELWEFIRMPCEWIKQEVLIKLGTIYVLVSLPLSLHFSLVDNVNELWTWNDSNKVWWRENEPDKLAAIDIKRTKSYAFTFRWWSCGAHFR